jgi:transglutaminase-like putative cysteine protease
MLYHLRHATNYDYEQPVVLGAHFLHLLPRERPGQNVRHAALTILPVPEERRDEIDHFGNRTTSIALTAAHKTFTVTLEAEVAVVHAPPPADAAQRPWEHVADEAELNAGVAEFTLPSPLAGPNDDIAAYARQSFPPDRPVLEALSELTHRLYTDLTYRPGSTGIATTAAHVLKTRSGVCQDYAHLMLACLRALGLPGRYVSGYLRTHPAPGTAKLRGADQSHAWVGAWIGTAGEAGDGWVDLDPTNDLLVVDEHVTLAWGRDFADVSPLRGVILGGGRHTLHVGVDLEPA